MSVLRKITVTLTGLLILAIAALLACMLLAVPINLAPLHGFVERHLARALARPVSIGTLELLPGLHSELTLTDLRIGNPDGWQGTEDFARIARTRVEFDVLALLGGEPTLHAIHGEDIELLLAGDRDGTHNWRLPDETAERTPTLSLTGPEELEARRVTVHYRPDPDTPSTRIVQFDQLDLSALDTSGFQFHTAGLSLLEGRAASDLTVTGELEVSDRGGAKPRLTARLHVPVLDLAEWFASESENAIPLDEKTLDQARAAETALGLDRERIRRIQTALTRRGFDTRGADGIIGNNTRHAIGAFQKQLGQAPSGYLTADQLALLLDEKRLASVAADDLFDRVLPTGKVPLDGAFELSVGRLVPAPGIEVGDLLFTGRLDNGRLEESTFRATLAGQRFDGTLMLDWRESPARARLGLTVGQPDIGALLRALHITDALDLKAARLDADWVAQGTTLRALLTEAAIDATVTDGSWTPDWTDGGANALELPLGRLRIRPGEPVTLSGTARLRDTALELTLQGEPLARMWANPDPSLRLTARAGGTALDLDATVSLLLNRGQARLKLEGDRLDRLDSLLGVALPPLGPYVLAGELRVAPSHYRLSDLALNLGDSDLRGQLRLAVGAPTPSLELDLQADRLHLDDFGLAIPGSSSRTALSAPNRAPPSPSDNRVNSPVDLGHRVLGDWLLSDRVKRLDARLSLQAHRLVLADNRLGPLSIVASLGNGRLVLEEGKLQLADGSIGLQLAMQPEAGGLNTELRAAFDHVDYGLLARLSAPDTQLRGHVSLTATLQGRAPTTDTFLAHASGPVRLLLQPEKLAAGPLTLWELNLLTLLLPRLDDSGSRVNCVTGQFAFDDGTVRLRPGALIIDTSKIRASGEGEVDFRTRRIDLTLVPKVKQPLPLDLATSVQVSGRFDDLGANIPPGGLIRTVANLALGVNRIWLRFFNWKGVPPADGSDICNDLPATAPPSAMIEDER